MPFSYVAYLPQSWVFQAYSKSLVLYSSKSDQCYAGWSITQIWYRAFASLQTNWGFILSILAIYILSKRIWPRYSIVLTVIGGIAVCPLFMEFHTPVVQWSLAQPVWMALNLAGHRF